jgi:hypothetical protein
MWSRVLSHVAPGHAPLHVVDGGRSGANPESVEEPSAA